LSTGSGNRTHKRGLFDINGKAFRYVAGVATVSDVEKLHSRLSVLENFISDNQSGTHTELSRLLVAERLMAHRVDGILADIYENALALNDVLTGMARHYEGVGRSLEWTKFYLAKFIMSVHHGNRVIHKMDTRIEGLQWLDQAVLSPAIVPTVVLENIMAYIQ